MSFLEYSRVLQTSKLSTDQDKVQMVGRVGDRTAKSTGTFPEESGRGGQAKSYQRVLNLIQDDKMVNAWCMPGGKVASYCGIPAGWFVFILSFRSLEREYDAR